MPKILVADDNANIQKMVVLAFEERGIQVVTVGNGEAAVRRIPDLNPDLVLADIFMPVRNGYEVCEFVKKDERFSHVPVILLVGAFDPLDEKEARRVGADGVLKKPFVPPDPLIAMVMSALEKNPRVAAEMAKAREAKEVLPEPVPQLEIPARAEPKPLPDFPEPTAEEAAMVYGFGKGVRALDDEPSAAKVPVAEAEDEDDADFDGASTSSDWRRNAMDFEVPPESANQPAFSSDDNLEPSTFPSESEVPPRRVRPPDPVEESDQVAQDQTPVATFAGAEFNESRAEQAPAIESAVEEPSAPEPFSEPPARIVSAESETEPASQAAAAIESETKSEPVSSAAHWMDALAPTPSELPSGGWMNSLAEPLPESSSVSYPADSAVESHEQVSLPVESIETRGEQDAAVEVPEPQDLNPVSHAFHQEPSFTDPPVPNEAPESWFAPAPSVFESDPDPVSEAIAVAKSEPDQGLEIDRVETQSSFAPRDPGLVESPAVRVTPEPLLVDSEESHGPSEYGSRPQQVSPLHSFFAPASGDPVVEEAMAAESSSFEQMGKPMPEFAPASSDANGRIPTGPPPSREALAGIPFLMPPPDFGQPTPESGSPNPETIDEVVRKVLAKLEPQIHDLLSKGVLKPLIENILQSELAKKEK
ncbi:MAG TPA: response regulator [Candidatus Cybelea sp.]|nr:response regulator [Candidatus Cybelea sp.]